MLASSKMKTFTFAIVLLLSFITSPSFARARVYIKNDTNSICKLENKFIKIGAVSYDPHEQIQSNQTDSLLTEASVAYGAEVELLYNCGGKKINLTCQENSGNFWSSEVNAKLGYADPGITATYTLTSGTFLHRTGKIEWEIVNTK